jgi:asparagine synthase (glutamine-hydrolysing)
MCGILGIVSFNKEIGSEELIKASAIIKHRGPDDEGFLTLNEIGLPVVWAGQGTADNTQQYWKYPYLETNTTFKLGLAHRRLSIVDLSPHGHQPMLYKDAGLAITFNGEVYNYIEIREELQNLGHNFATSSDTEVILHAWAEWGEACLHKFNGMFAFLLVDYSRKKLFAVRDRFGVKPLYYYSNGEKIVFASEIKQIRAIKGFRPSLNENISRDFLANGYVDHTTETFDTQINQVPPGHFISVNIDSFQPDHKIIQWYQLQPQQWEGGWDKAVNHFRELLTDAVKLRLRADVSIGSCLSGGLDSSSIVCIASELLKANGEFEGQETVTACFEDARYDEWKYAEMVVKKSGAHPHRVFTSFDDLTKEFDAFLWYQDEPTGSTSMFSQWTVFKKAHEEGLKVMIDGQGADEQLAGYTGNDIPLYAGLLGKGKYGALLHEIRQYRKQKGAFPISFILGAIQASGSGLNVLLPASWKLGNAQKLSWLHNDLAMQLPAKDLKSGLLRQIHQTPLPGLLRYEDRNSMAWSIESRTPFMDYRLFEFTLGLPEEYVYKNGITKRVLREAMQPVLPPEVSNRKDKMGFVTPEEVWLKGEGRVWFNDWVNYTCNNAPSFVDGNKLKAEIENIIAGKQPFSFLPWRVSVFGNWVNKNF